MVAAAYRAAQLEWVKCLKSACKRKYKMITSAWWLKNWQSGTTGREYYKISSTPSKGLLATRNKAPKALGSIITQMRTGKIGLRSYLWRINRADTDECDCGRGAQTVRHIITECDNFTELRHELFGRGEPFGNMKKVIGEDTAQLLRAATLMHRTGLLAQFNAVEVQDIGE